MKTTGDRFAFIARPAGLMLQVVIWMFVGFYCTSASTIFWAGVIAILGVIECTIFVLWANDLGQYLRERRRGNRWLKFGNRKWYRLSAIENWLVPKRRRE